MSVDVLTVLEDIERLNEEPDWSSVDRPVIRNSINDLLKKVQDADEGSVNSEEHVEESNVNPVTGEINGPKGPEPTRYGDWERKGRVYDF